MKGHLSLLLSLFFLVSCDSLIHERGNGKIESEKRSVDSFTEVRLEGNYEVGLKHGLKEQVVIVTDENLLQYIDTEVEHGVLIIEDSEKIRSQDGIKIYITYNSLTSLRSAGASVIKSEDKIVSEVFSLEVPGAGVVELEVEVNDLEVVLAGAGLVKLSGSARSQSVSLNGVGSLEAYELESDNCEVSVSGVGGAKVNVKENLNANVNGIGGIKYKGNPKVVNDRVSGIGTIRKADEDDDDA